MVVLQAPSAATGFSSSTSYSCLAFPRNDQFYEKSFAQFSSHGLGYMGYKIGLKKNARIEKSRVTVCSAETVEKAQIVQERSVSVVPLAGGKGKRMGVVHLNSEFVCIHDSARPLVSSGGVKKVLRDGLLQGAAVLGVPVKATVKEANSESFVVKTLDRKTLWEMQTPQVIKPELLRRRFELGNSNDGGCISADDHYLRLQLYIQNLTDISCPTFLTEA